MPRARYRQRGGVVRYRTKRTPHGFIRLAIVRKKGPRGGRTIGTYHRRKGK